jgi:TPR repeat protein
MTFMDAELPLELPRDPPPPPPPQIRAPMDVRWLTDLGVVYFRRRQFGEAFLCFSQAAQQGFATAQFCLAVCHFNGHGTALDEAAALPWLRQAAAQGDANAEFTLGLAYRLGRGVAPDESLAAQWLHKAAAHGHPGAIQQKRC